MLDDIIWKGCADGNWQVGRMGNAVLGIVIHEMGGSLIGTDAWFNLTPAARDNGGFASSAHYGIGKAGERHQYVKEEDRADHAGRVLNATAKLILDHPGVNPNLFTIGIEHEEHAAEPWTDAMVTASAGLIADICKRWSIPIDRDHIIGHHEVFSAKTCPGTGCDLDALVAQAAALTKEPT